MKASKTVASALIVLTLAGCGGGGKSSGPGGGGSADASVAFAADAGYNGSTAALTGTIASVGLNATRIVSFGSNSRSVNFTFPKRTFVVGDTFSPGSGGTYVDYREVVARDGGTRKWTGTGGTVKVTAATDDKVDITFDSVSFAPDQTDGDVQAAGTFTIRGAIKGFPNEAASTSSADVRFSSVDAEGVNADPYPADASIVLDDVDDQLFVAVIKTENFLPASQISFRIPKDAAIGTALPVSTSSSGIRADFFQLDGSLMFSAREGTVTIVSKTATGIALTFSGLLFKDTGHVNSTQSFVVNGSIAK